MTKLPKGLRPGRYRMPKDTRSLEERTRQRIAANRETFGDGPKILDEVARVFRREYTPEEQFLVMSDEYPSPEVDDPPWESAFSWQRGPLIMPAGCRLVLRSKAGGVTVVIGCRKRWLRGDPPTDADNIADLMSSGPRPWEYKPVDGSSPVPRPVPEPPVLPPVRHMVELCVATATHSGEPVLVRDDLTDAEKRKAVRAITRDVRRVAQGNGQIMTAPPPRGDIIQTDVPDGGDMPDGNFDNGLGDAFAGLDKLNNNPGPNPLEAYSWLAWDEIPQETKMEAIVPGWRSKMAVTITEARRMGEAQVKQREERLSPLLDAAAEVADLLVGRSLALEIQSQLRLDFCSLEARRPGAGRAVTLTFRLIDPPRQDLDPSSCSETERTEILAGYQSWAEIAALAEGDLGGLPIGAQYPRMVVAAECHPGVVEEVSPMTFQNPCMTAEEYLDDFLTSVVRLVEYQV